MDEQNLSPAFYKVNALTQEQRDKAYADARKRIAGQKPTKGDEPQYSDFERNAFTKYPLELMRFMRLLFYAILFAAFVPSAIRIFLASFEGTAIYLPAFEIAILIGVMAVLLAETGQVAFTLWASTTDGRLLRLGLYLASIGCTAFALIANAYVVKPFDHPHPMSFLEAFLPPILVLIAANVRKSEILHTIGERHQTQQEFAEAHRQWQTQFKTDVKAWNAALGEAEKSPQWERTLVNVLRDAIRNANKVSKQALRELTHTDWHALVMRERKAEEWWDTAVAEVAAIERKTQRIVVQPQPVIALPLRNGISTGTTGEVARVKIEREGKLFVKACPVCRERFAGETQRSATNRLVAHMKKHANERKAIALPMISMNGSGGRNEDEV